METRERGTAAPASGNGAELDWRELGRRVRRMRQAELLRGPAQGAPGDDGSAAPPSERAGR